MPPRKPRKIGRPSSFRAAVALRICERIAGGESLRTICEDPRMPHRSTVLRWLAAKTPAAARFRDQYARAREAQADALAEECIAIADESTHDWVDRERRDGTVERVPDPEVVARSRLRFDARRWFAGKVAPKKYGDKVQTEVTGADGGPVAIRTMADLVREVDKAGETE